MSDGIVVLEYLGRHELLQALSNKRRRINNGNSPYISANFILGSTVEMEKVWSVSKYLLPDTRKCMESVVFEALLFLKVNHRYWNLNSVRIAMADVRNVDEEAQRLGGIETHIGIYVRE